MTWLAANWEVVLLASLYVADKVVKLTPTDKDDFVVDVVYNTIKKLLGK